MYYSSTKQRGIPEQSSKIHKITFLLFYFLKVKFGAMYTECRVAHEKTLRSTREYYIFYFKVIRYFMSVA